MASVINSIPFIPFPYEGKEVFFDKRGSASLPLSFCVPLFNKEMSGEIIERLSASLFPFFVLLLLGFLDVLSTFTAHYLPPS